MVLSFKDGDLESARSAEDGQGLPCSLETSLPPLNTGAGNGTLLSCVVDDGSLLPSGISAEALMSPE